MSAPLFVELVRAGLLLGACAMLLRTSWTDFIALKIYNRDVLVLLVLALALLPFIDTREMLLRVGFAAICFTTGGVLWMLGKMGAGDVKLLGVAPLLFPPQNVYGFLLLVVLLSVGLAYSHVVTKRLQHVPQTIGRRVSDIAETRRLPYGVPISFATIVVMIVPLLADLGPA